jgi:hypothetical protein
MFNTFKELENWYNEQIDQLTEKFIDNNWSDKRVEREREKLSDKYHELSKPFFFKDAKGNIQFSPVRIK